jgi:hypothetical protein
MQERARGIVRTRTPGARGCQSRFRSWSPGGRYRLSWDTTKRRLSKVPSLVIVPSATTPILAAAVTVRYGQAVLRRSASLLAFLALIAAPAVNSTRLFCRYTGEEIIDCAEAAAPDHGQIREDGCCQQRMFHALQGVRLAGDQRQQAPVPVAMGAAPAVLANAFVLAPSVARRATVPSAGPPAFLSHRALLI